MISWRGMVLRRDISFVFDGKRGYFGTGDFKGPKGCESDLVFNT